MTKRNALLVICGLLLLAVSAWVRLRAQSCTGGYQNFGILQQYYCTYGAVQCEGDVCESDLCNGAPCGGGQGWITYCVAQCDSYPGCITCGRPQ